MTSAYEHVADVACRRCGHDATQHNGPTGDTCAQCRGNRTEPCVETLPIITRARVYELEMWLNRIAVTNPAKVRPAALREAFYELPGVLIGAPWKDRGRR